jgi:quinol monooxygenase YgiN
MATILAHLRVKPGAEARFEAIARQLYAETHAHEAGVRRYEYWRGADERTYYTLLSFDDVNAFIDHQVSDHHESAAPQLGEVLESIRLEWLDPIEHASPLGPTVAQDPPPDASETFARAHARYAARIADWWSGLR